MSFFRKLFNRASTPPAKSRVKGFSLTVEKKEGTLLTTKPEDRVNDINQKHQHARPEAVTYYEATIKSNGKNPEYPRKFDNWKHRFCIAPPEKGELVCGFTNSTAYIQNGGSWTKFELKEEFYDAKKVIQMGNFRPPSHHSVSLIAHYKAADGQTGQVSVGGGWVRKSERNTQAWRNAENDKTFWL